LGRLAYCTYIFTTAIEQFHHMPYPNLFDATTTQNLLLRIASLQPTDKAHWGKMSVSQMLAHVNLTFQGALNPNPKRPPLPLRLLLQLLVKKQLVNDKPFKKKSQTASELIVKHQPDFATELQKLQQYLQQVSEDGGAQFAYRRHPAFGAFTQQEWSTMLYKHLDHHLQQFGR
jgi:hypothetical protein